MYAKDDYSKKPMDEITTSALAKGDGKEILKFF